MYEKLPLVDFTAPRVISHRTRAGNISSNDTITQDFEDAEAILMLAGLNANISPADVINAREKYMIEMQPGNETTPSQITDVSMRQRGLRKPHYTRLLVFDERLLFQAACCLPLKIIAASLDGAPVFGRVLFCSYSEESGGKLVYEFTERGAELVVDLKRGEKSTKAQRHIFSGIE